VLGRKRHILTDTDGRLLSIQVHGANIQDRDGAKGVLKRSRARFPFVEHAYGDGGYAGRLVRWAKEQTHIGLEVVTRRAAQMGFAVIRRRWAIERTLSARLMPSIALARASMRCAVLRRGSFLASRRRSTAVATSVLIASPAAAISTSQTEGRTESRPEPHGKHHRVRNRARRY
jgi:transposase